MTEEEHRKALERKAAKRLLKEMGAAWWHHISTFFPGERERQIAIEVKRLEAALTPREDAEPAWEKP